MRTEFRRRYKISVGTAIVGKPMITDDPVAETNPRKRLVAVVVEWDDAEHEKGKPFWDLYPDRRTEVGE